MSHLINLLVIDWNEISVITNFNFFLARCYDGIIPKRAIHYEPVARNHKTRKDKKVEVSHNLNLAIPGLFFPSFILVRKMLYIRRIQDVLGLIIERATAL